MRNRAILVRRHPGERGGSDLVQASHLEAEKGTAGADSLGLRIHVPRWRSLEDLGVIWR